MCKTNKQTNKQFTRCQNTQSGCFSSWFELIQRNKIRTNKNEFAENHRNPNIYFSRRRYDESTSNPNTHGNDLSTSQVHIRITLEKYMQHPVLIACQYVLDYAMWR